MSQLGPIGNWLYRGATQPRSFYQNMSLGEALASENPFSSKYAGYSSKYTGPGKVGFGKYISEGLKSLGSVFGGTPSTIGNIAGGTPGARALYEAAVRTASPLRTALTNPLVGLAGMGGYYGGLGLMNATNTEDDVAALGAMFNETGLGRLLGESLLGYSTPELNAITSMYANPNVQVDTTSNYQDRIQQVAAAEAAAAAAAAEEAETIRELAMSGQGGSDNRPVSSQTSSPLGGMLGASIHGGYNTPASPSPHAGSTFRTLSGSTSGGGTGSQGGNPHGGGGGGGLGPTGGMGGRFTGTSRF